MISKLLIKLVRFYQRFISPGLPKSCRYYPTCSTYMIDSLKKHGPILGLIQGISRILRCNPLVRGGVDPVGEKFTLFRNPHPEDYEDEIIAAHFHTKEKK